MVADNKGNDAGKAALASHASQERIFTSGFLTIALVNMVMFMGFQMTSTGIPVYADSIGATSLEVGFVTTFATLSALIVRPLSGMALDRFGRKGLFIAALAVMALAVSLFSAFPVVWVLLALRFLQGIGWGVSSTAASTIAADLIPRSRFAEGMGYFALTGAVAVAIGPALATALLERASIEVMVAVCAACTVAALALALFLPRGATTPPQQTEEPLLSRLFDRTALIPAVLIALINVSFASITTYIVLHGQAQGIEGIALYFVVYALITIVSRPVIGKIVDRAGFFWPGLLSVVGVVATFVVISLADSVALFCVAGVFAGLGFGTAMSTFQAMAVASAPARRRGVATSTYMFGFDGGIAIGSVVAGLLVGMLGYSGMYLAITVFPLAAGIVLVAMGPKRLASYSAQAGE